MDYFLYWPVRLLVMLIQALPLPVVAQLGRTLARPWWWIDGKHRGLVLRNLSAAFPEKGPAEIRGIALETFLRIGENSLAAIKTASMGEAQLLSVCEVVGTEKLPRAGGADSITNCVGAVGHFGNFELYARVATPATGWRAAATYRGMNQPALNSIVQQLRSRSGCLFFERRTQAGELKEALGKGGIFLGLLSDQHPRKGGVLVPFLGRNCATSTAPAVFAMRYHAPLFTVINYRVALGRWRIEVGDEIPLRENGAPRPLEAIMTDVNRAFEAAIRRDPANWFWVHDRWKKPRIKRVSSPPSNEPDDPGTAPASPSV